MRKLILILWLAMISIAGTTPAQASTEWMGWGHDPYASSDEEALRKLPDALSAMNVPAPVRALFQAEVARNPQGRHVYLNAGDRLSSMMWSPSGDVRSDVIVGYHLVRRGVVWSAEAREWRVEYEGQVYVLVRPEVCRNWAWRTEPLPRSNPPEECSTVEVVVRAGDTLLPAALASDALPPSQCWAVKTSGDWVAWPGGCASCVHWDTLLADTRLPRGLTVQTQSRITVTQTGSVWVRVPRAVESRHLAFYLLRDGLCSWKVLTSSDWQEHAFRISGDSWTWRPVTAR